MSTNPETISPDSDAWPKLAPRWATHADVWPDGDIVFMRAWALPSTFRGAGPVLVVQVHQQWELLERGSYGIGTPYVAADEDALWADWRAEDVASALREIADALDPHEVAPPEHATPVAAQEGEDG
ncbi:MAG: hypothetical protein AB7K08_11650 [Microbacteriaceae bacterium]